jgi:hypothetical protein
MDQALVDSAWSAVIKTQPKSEQGEEKKIPISQFFSIIHELEQLCSSQQTAAESKKLPLVPLLSAYAVELMERLIRQNSTKAISKFQFNAILSDLLIEEPRSTASPSSWAQKQQQRSKRRSISLCTYPKPAAPQKQQQQRRESSLVAPELIPASNTTPDHQKTILKRQLSTYEQQLQKLQENETRRLHHIEEIEHELDHVQTELVLRREQQNAEFTNTRAAVNVTNGQAKQEKEEEEALIQALFTSELGAWDNIKDRLNQLEEEKNEYLEALAAMTAERSGYLLVIDSLNQQVCNLRVEIDQLKSTYKPSANNNNNNKNSSSGSTKVNLLLANKNSKPYVTTTDFFTNLVAGEFTITSTYSSSSSYFTLAMIGACIVGLFLPLFFVV